MGMRARLLLWISLGLNVLAGAALLFVARGKQPATGPETEILAQDNPEKIFKTNVVVRRQGFTWSEVESNDFPNYIRNLRRIGCPEKTIRDIIIAEVNDLFAERIARDVVLPEQKWWLPDPDMDALQSAMDQVRVLEAEKGQLLTQLLGAGWDSHRSATASIVRFDGPVLSKLPAETRSQVERIEATSRRARTEAEEKARQAGQPLDAAELNRLRLDTRKQLAAVLSPDALEEYLLRYSATAEQMREDLRGYGADADEFRRIFRTRDGFEQQIAALDPTTPASAARRLELERERDAALRQTVGAERFSFYQMVQNPLFRQAQDQAEQNGAPVEKVLPIFRVNQAAEAEIARIQGDGSLSDDQRRLALVTVQQQQQNSIDRILGNQPSEEPAPAQQAQAAAQSPPAGTINVPENALVLPPLPPPISGPVRTKGPATPPRRR